MEKTKVQKITVDHKLIIDSFEYYSSIMDEMNKKDFGILKREDCDIFDDATEKWGDQLEPPQVNGLDATGSHFNFRKSKVENFFEKLSLKISSLF
jgi:hypothetical protein